MQNQILFGTIILKLFLFISTTSVEFFRIILFKSFLYWLISDILLVITHLKEFFSTDNSLSIYSFIIKLPNLQSSPFNLKNLTSAKRTDFLQATQNLADGLDPYLLKRIFWRSKRTCDIVKLIRRLSICIYRKKCCLT